MQTTLNGRELENLDFLAGACHVENHGTARIGVFLTEAETRGRNAERALRDLITIKRGGRQYPDGVLVGGIRATALDLPKAETEYYRGRWWCRVVLRAGSGGLVETRSGELSTWKMGAWSELQRGCQGALYRALNEAGEELGYADWVYAYLLNEGKETRGATTALRP